MSTPIETATEAILANLPVPKADPPGWLAASARSDAQAALSSLAQHRDDIARALYDHDQTMQDVRRWVPWPDAHQFVVEDYRERADAVLDHLTGESA